MRRHSYILLAAGFFLRAAWADLEVLPDGRIDAGFLAGDTSRNGFSIPSVRLGVVGSLSPQVGFKLAAGQTREFSTALLPQLLPVEALITVSSEEAEDGFEAEWRLGLFTPLNAPFWTPDLSELWLPDYGQLEQDMLVFRDIGTEIQVWLPGRSIRLAAGAFNGNGIIAQNYNNSRAFTGTLEWHVGGEDSKVTVGVSGYQLNQATSESVNYKARSEAGLFFLYEDRLTFYLHALAAYFADSSGSRTPIGLGAVLAYNFGETWKFFIRAEAQREIAGTFRQHYQAGPIWQFQPNIAVQLFYDYSDFLSTAAALNTAQFRFRLVF